MRMSDMKYGVRSYFSALLKGRIMSPATMPQDLVETMYIKKTYDKIQKAETPCIAVRELMRTDYPEPMKTFFRETGKTYSVTGGNKSECKRLLTDYLNWLGSKVEKPSLPKIPKVPEIPKMPSLGDVTGVGDIKRSLQVSAVALMLFILAIFYLIFVRGKGAEGVSVTAVGK